jgi:aryl-alcohol dehydrogenase-like predicted oxidoreductase
VRYRPIGRTGAIISSVSLGLWGGDARARPGDWTALVYAALENGINGFDVAGADAALAEGIRQAFSAVDRKLVFVSWRLGGAGEALSATGLGDQIREALAASDLDYLDAVMLDDPPERLPDDAMETLERLKASGLVRAAGVVGDSDAIDAHVAGAGFDLLSTRFNLTSGWRERHRLRSAGACDMAVIGYGYVPRELAAPASRPERREPLSGCGTYAFLEETHGWKADEICLAYALTEPALASIRLRPGSIAELERLAAVVDRDMPPGVAAQIEMARFSPPGQDQAATRRHA